jgi:hypothetical protein
MNLNNQTGILTEKDLNNIHFHSKPLNHAQTNNQENSASNSK